MKDKGKNLNIWYNTPHTRSIILYDYKYKLNGYVLSVRIYKVPISEDYLEGIRYSLVLLKDNK